jgi:two-component system alkaline phosphatase synthesis response regulator PhoP
MKSTRILLVDDEPEVLDFLSYNLKKEGSEVFTATDGRSAIELAKQVLPDLIILDVMMPIMDGIAACKELRILPETRNALIVFLSARTEDYSLIAGLEAGADDYICKPLKLRILISRIYALLRSRVSRESIDLNIMDVGGGIKINKDSYSISVGKEEHTLPKKEFELISLLASRPDKVFTREDILNEVWGENIVIGDRTIDVHIRKLRQKIGEDKIRTIKGVGYKFRF